jgi:hypothetical protein
VRMRYSDSEQVRLSLKEIHGSQAIESRDLGPASSELPLVLTPRQSFS